MDASVHPLRNSEICFVLKYELYFDMESLSMSSTINPSEHLTTHTGLFFRNLLPCVQSYILWRDTRLQDLSLPGSYFSGLPHQTGDMVFQQYFQSSCSHQLIRGIAHFVIGRDIEVCRVVPYTDTKITRFLPQIPHQHHIFL